MDNANPSPTNNRHVLPTALRTKVVQELHELQAFSTFVDSRLESIEQFLSGFTNQPNEINMDDLESDDESYGNTGTLRRKRIINSFDGDDLAVQCMNGFRKFTAYFDPFLSMNIFTRKAYNTIMVEGLESTKMNLVSIVKDVYVFVRSFTYVIDFVVLEDTGEFILREMSEVVMGKPFREVAKPEYDCAKGLMSFTRIFDNYIFQMPRTIPRFKS
ncbi:hypothetical protein Tco_0400588 [Tanacetum coccineum]